MPERISAADAKARFSEILMKVSAGGSRFIVERHGKPVAAVVSVADLDNLEAQSGPTPKQGALALLGLWADVGDEEIDAMIRHIYEERGKDKGRPVNLEP